MRDGRQQRYTGLTTFYIYGILGPHLEQGQFLQFNTRIDIVTNGGKVVQTYTPTPASSVQWSPLVQDATNTYYFVRVWSSGGGDAPGADPANPVAWLAPVWTGR